MKLPERLKPMLAVLGDLPFDSPDWIFEIKLDGYRAVAAVDGEGNVDIYSRNLLSFNKDYPSLIPELAKIQKAAILDGEIVIEDEHGVSSFQLLQNYKKTGQGFPKYYVFDLLYLNGKNITAMPLIHRKELLRELLNGTPFNHIAFSRHTIGKGLSFFENARKNNYEGIIAKVAQSPYRISLRSREWLKIKINQEQEAIVAGITQPKGSRTHFGALLLAVYSRGKLKYIGKCGTGFTDTTLQELYALFEPLFTGQKPFDEKIPEKDVQWLIPKVVCQVKFTEWTNDMHMRHPVYVGLREDKKAQEVVAEVPQRKLWKTK